jgi:hypothetical protein
MKNKMKLTQAKFRKLVLEELAPAVDAYMRHHYGVEPAPSTRLSQKDLKRIKPEASTTERPPPLPIGALAQRKDIIALPKSTVKLKKILSDLMTDAVFYADTQDPEVGDALENIGGPQHFSRFKDSIVMSLLRDLRSLNVEKYLQENINDFIYIKESTCKQILSDVINKRGILIWN